MQRLLNEIVKNNPELQKDSIYIFLNTTEVPNAASVGENMLIFNTGLLNRLENESQIAFVLSHELAHLSLAHSNKQIAKYIETLYSKDFQKELKLLQSLAFNKRTQFENLTKALSFDSRKHSRYKESEADSMAIVFLLNSKFDASESINALAILDTIDKEDFNAEEVLSSTFNSTIYPFKKSWLLKEEGLFGGHAVLEKNKVLEDSLKTHPECSVRIKQMREQLKQVATKTGAKNVVNAAYLQTLQYNLTLDNLENYLNHKNFGLSLFYALKRLAKDSSNLYITTVIAKSLNNIFDAQKSHTLNKFVDFPSPYYSKSYNSCLQFIQNLDLSEIANISLAYLKKFEAVYGGDNGFNKTMMEAKKRVNLSK